MLDTECSERMWVGWQVGRNQPILVWYLMVKIGKTCIFPMSFFLWERLPFSICKKCLCPPMYGAMELSLSTWHAANRLFWILLPLCVAHHIYNVSNAVSSRPGWCMLKNRVLCCVKSLGFGDYSGPGSSADDNRPVFVFTLFLLSSSSSA